jgi:flagellar basal-body rod protein FlgB
MAINFDQALGLHPEALKLRSERMKILASNLANESTPGYQARDIDFKASLNQALNSATGATAVGGAALESGSVLDQNAPALLYRVPNLTSEDGNTVELGVEQAAFSQNASDFQTSLTFINMTLRDLAKAIQGQ